MSYSIHETAPTRDALAAKLDDAFQKVIDANPGHPELKSVWAATQDMLVNLDAGAHRYTAAVAGSMTAHGAHIGSINASISVHCA